MKITFASTFVVFLCLLSLSGCRYATDEAGGPGESPPPYWYTAAGSDGLEVFDLRADPAHPVLIATCDTLGNAYYIAVSGNYAYIADNLLAID